MDMCEFFWCPKNFQIGFRRIFVSNFWDLENCVLKMENVNIFYRELYKKMGGGGGRLCNARAIVIQCDSNYTLS